MATIDNLNIQVVSNSNNAVNSLELLASVLKRLNATASALNMNHVVSELYNVRDAADNASKAVNRLVNAFNRLKNNQSSSGTRGFSDDIKRTANAADMGTAALARYSNAMERVFRMQNSAPHSKSAVIDKQQLTGQVGAIYTDFVDNEIDSQMAAKYKWSFPLF